MSRTLANRSTFTFNGSEYLATSVTVEAPQPEIVNMTAHDAPGKNVVMVATGAYTSPGSIEVEAFGMMDPVSLIGVNGQATFKTPSGSVTRQCVCSAASVSGQVGDLLRVRFSLTPTDYTGQ